MATGLSEELVINQTNPEQTAAQVAKIKAVPEPNPNQKLSPAKNKKMILVIVGVVVLLFLALILLSLNRKTAPVSPVTPTAAPTLTPTPTSIPPSVYATDSAVLKIEADLVQNENLLKATKFGESSLLPPEIDLEVKF